MQHNFYAFSFDQQTQFSFVFFLRVTAIIFAAAKSLQSCPTLCDPIDGSPPGLPRPWDSPGKNTGVGCHFLLQCMKVKSESEVAQSCPTLHDPMDCSLPGSSVHGIFQARVTRVGCHFLLQIHESSWSILLNFQILGDFAEVFLLLISNLILFCSKNFL